MMAQFCFDIFCVAVISLLCVTPRLTFAKRNIGDERAALLFPLGAGSFPTGVLIQTLSMYESPSDRALLQPCYACNYYFQESEENLSLNYNLIYSGNEIF